MWYSIGSHFSVNACLAPLCSVDHMAVTTIEGIGSTRTKIHPVQVRIVINYKYRLHMHVCMH